MPTIIYTTGYLADLDRVTAFMQKVSPQSLVDMLLTIDMHITNLASHPLLGHSFAELIPHFQNIRRIIIPFGSHNYVAFYEYDTKNNEVIVAGLKHSKELMNVMGFVQP